MTAVAEGEISRGADEGALPCPACGYDLRGLAAGACPECGRAFSLEELHAAASIPWQQRRRVGWWRGLTQTARLAMRHPRRLAEQIHRDVDYRHARRFHATCCLLAWLGLSPLAVGVFLDLRQQVMRDGVYLWAVSTTGPNPPIPPASLVLDGLVLAAMLAGLFVWLLTATGVASYFFHPRDLPRARQDRAVAMSYYAAAPLAVMPAAMILFYMGYAIYELTDSPSPSAVSDYVQLLLVFLSLAIVLFVVLDVLLIAWTLLRHSLHRSLARAALMVVLTAAAAPVLFVVWVILPPLGVLWLEAVILLLAR